MKRTEALKIHLGIESADNFKTDSNRKEYFEYGNQEYLVLTDHEAYKATREHIRESLWAFNAEFFIQYCVPLRNLNGDKEAVLKAIRKMQETLCESCNELVYALVRGRFASLVKDAIAADGRGHFLSGYDGKETVIDSWYIYRLN